METNFSLGGVEYWLTLSLSRGGKRWAVLIRGYRYQDKVFGFVSGIASGVGGVITGALGEAWPKHHRKRVVFWNDYCCPENDCRQGFWYGR